MNFKSQNAITIGSLIITIILLLIFAIVIITQLKSSDLFNKTQFAKEEYTNSMIQEEEVLNGMSSYLSITNDNQTIISSKGEPWNGATMLTITITNLTGGVFTINVNNVEAHNYGILYYYVNNTLVYSGTNKSFQVMELNGEPLKQGAQYNVKVLTDPFDVKVVMQEGDNVDSWLACIGNPNINKYRFDTLDELFQDKTLIEDLFLSEEGFNYLLKSTEIIYPYYKSLILEDEDLQSIVCKSSYAFSDICNDSTNFAQLCNQFSWRNAMYNNASITEAILRNSTVAQTAMKSCTSQYEVVNKTMSSSYQTLYEGKAFVLGVSQNWHRGSTAATMTHGNYIIGNATGSYSAGGDGYTSTGLGIKVNRFASTVVQKNSYGSNSSYKCFAAIFKID